MRLPNARPEPIPLRFQKKTSSAIRVTTPTMAAELIKTLPDSCCYSDMVSCDWRRCIGRKVDRPGRTASCVRGSDKNLLRRLVALPEL